jgi:hypothetical protein
MIVSASFRTDIPAHYGAWFLRRLDAGFAMVSNPYGGPGYRVSLAPGEADGFVFWTRNAGPFIPILNEAKRRGFPFVVQFTITGYPRVLELGTLDTETAIGQLRAIAHRFGPRAAVWRYDPIVVSDSTPVAWHRANFAHLARALRGASDEAVTSFAEPYRKTARNLAAAFGHAGLAWRDPPLEEKRALAADLAAIAAEERMRLTLCTQPALLPGAAEAARCIDAARLSDVAGRAIAARTKGNRPGCLCAESRDIGAYDTCAQGCAYCYAVGSRPRAQAALRAHDPARANLAAPHHAKPTTPAVPAR